MLSRAPILRDMRSRRAKVHAHWALFMGVYYASLCYSETIAGFDVPALAPYNFSLSIVVAGIGIQWMAKARKRG